MEGQRAEALRAKDESGRIAVNVAKLPGQRDGNG
jgi:hypothetical protein